MTCLEVWDRETASIARVHAARRLHGSSSNSIAIVLIEAEHCLKRSIFLVLNGCGSATNEGIRYGCGGTRTRALSRCGSTSLCSRCFGSL